MLGGEVAAAHGGSCSGCGGGGGCAAVEAGWSCGCAGGEGTACWRLLHFLQRRWGNHHLRNRQQLFSARCAFGFLIIMMHNTVFHIFIVNLVVVVVVFIIVIVIVANMIILLVLQIWYGYAGRGLWIGSHLGLCVDAGA